MGYNLHDVLKNGLEYTKTTIKKNLVDIKFDHFSS